MEKNELLTTISVHKGQGRLTVYYYLSSECIDFKIKCNNAGADNKCKFIKRFFLPSGKHRVADSCSMFSFFIPLYSNVRVYEILLFQAPQPNLIKLAGVVE